MYMNLDTHTHTHLMSQCVILNASKLFPVCKKSLDILIGFSWNVCVCVRTRNTKGIPHWLFWFFILLIMIAPMFSHLGTSSLSL